jgi:hypothetical protein
VDNFLCRDEGSRNDQLSTFPITIMSTAWSPIFV